MDIVTIIAASFVALTLYFLMKRYVTPAPPSQLSSAGGKGKEGEKEKGKEKGKEKEEQKVPLKIFFGSQTGTAEEFSNTLADEAVAYGFAPEVFISVPLSLFQALPFRLLIWKT